MTGPRIWTHPALIEVLPRGLPCGGLSVLHLMDNDPEGQLWRTAVGQLIAATVQRGQPVLFVGCGGARFYARIDWLSEAFTTPLLAVHEDEDLIVYGPPSQPSWELSANGPLEPVTLDGRPYYTCNVPTLQTLRPVLEAHEARRGAALVILDAFSWARPYHRLMPSLEGLPPVPGGLILPTGVVAGWLVSDLLEFSALRPQAPTFVVWPEPAPVPTQERLQTAALLHVTAYREPAEDAVVLSSYHRSSVTEPWPQGSVTRVGMWSL